MKAIFHYLRTTQTKVCRRVADFGGRWLAGLSAVVLAAFVINPSVALAAPATLEINSGQVTISDTTVAPGDTVQLDFSFTNPTANTINTAGLYFRGTLPTQSWQLIFCQTPPGDECTEALPGPDVSLFFHNVGPNETRTGQAMIVINQDATDFPVRLGVQWPQGNATQYTEPITIAVTPPVPPADVTVTKTGPAAASIGDTFTYDLAVRNNGPSTATNVTLTDAVPAALNVLSAQPEQGSCSVISNTVTCELGALSADPANEVTIQLLVEPAEAATFTNTATVEASEPDTNLSNNSTTVSTTVNNAHGCTIIGTPGPDTLAGTSGNDVICALSGNDHVDSLAGSDTLLGGTGDDVLTAGQGDDSLISSAGNDTLNGNDGEDTLIDTLGNDTLNGGNGSDDLFARDGAGGDTLSGGLPLLIGDSCHFDLLQDVAFGCDLLSGLLSADTSPLQTIGQMYTGRHT